MKKDILTETFNKHVKLLHEKLNITSEEVVNELSPELLRRASNNAMLRGDPRGEKQASKFSSKANEREINRSIKIDLYTRKGDHCGNVAVVDIRKVKGTPFEHSDEYYFFLLTKGKVIINREAVDDVGLYLHSYGPGAYSVTVGRRDGVNVFLKRQDAKALADAINAKFGTTLSKPLHAGNIAQI